MHAKSFCSCDHIAKSFIILKSKPGSWRFPSLLEKENSSLFIVTYKTCSGEAAKIITDRIYRKNRSSMNGAHKNEKSSAQSASWLVYIRATAVLAVCTVFSVQLFDSGELASLTAAFDSLHCIAPFHGFYRRTRFLLVSVIDGHSYFLELLRSNVFHNRCSPFLHNFINQCCWTLNPE